ncbi:DUF411 domain-containing protein [Comamonas sp. NLF-7-7]|uniref:DUF411 domain-containing protein n=1 Tax=Comamonas flocculans TaxID=2597701 RepID=A0A5B8RSV2_9BURK|nr:DUF411 domain-containing protein [Comamonas flocculans]
MSTLAPTRRQMLASAAGLAALAAGAAPAAQPMVQVWKDPSCGCCKDWIAHMQANGFATTVHESGNAGARARLGLPRELGSCHTALVEGYVLEGHVPARDVQRLLSQRPKALGLAVPGMPVGSPGMDGPAYGGRKDAYEVLLVRRAGKAGEASTEVFARYG